MTARARTENAQTKLAYVLGLARQLKTYKVGLEMDGPCGLPEVDTGSVRVGLLASKGSEADGLPQKLLVRRAEGRYIEKQVSTLALACNVSSLDNGRDRHQVSCTPEQVEACGHTMSFFAKHALRLPTSICQTHWRLTGEADATV